MPTPGQIGYYAPANSNTELETEVQAGGQHRQRIADPDAQATLTSILAKIVTAPALDSTLQSVLAALQGTLKVAQQGTVSATIANSPTVNVANLAGLALDSTLATSNANTAAIQNDTQALNGTTGTTTDPATATTLVGLLKAIKAAVQGTLTTSVSNFPASQTVAGTVSVSNFPATQAVTFPQGASVSVSNFPATQTVAGSVSVANLPATQAVSATQLPAALDTDGSLKVADVFTSGETLPSQAGAGAALTFTFASARDLIWVKSVGGNSMADPFGGTPSATAGIPCEDGLPQPLTVRAATVKVFAPSGATVYVWGYSG